SRSTNFERPSKLNWSSEERSNILFPILTPDEQLKAVQLRNCPNAIRMNMRTSQKPKKVCISI
ncbi:11640_t:CDS:1, partial [Scutellospora calospora]